MVRVGFGRGRLPKGALPVFSVNSDDEAERLIVAACPRDIEGNYYARELAEEQSLENLEAFSQRLERIYAMPTFKKEATP
jgi:hypothetical protein